MSSNTEINNSTSASPQPASLAIMTKNLNTMYESDSDTDDSIISSPHINRKKSTASKSPFVSTQEPIGSPVVPWASYDSKHTFKYEDFSRDKKIELFEVISKYYIYCNKVDKKSFPQFIGTTNEQFKNIIYCLLSWGGKAEWVQETNKRINYPVFIIEYFSYIKNVTPSKKDSFDVNFIMKHNNYNNNRILTKEIRNQVFHNILTRYYEEYIVNKGEDYNLTKVQEFGINIYLSEMNISDKEIKSDKINYIFKQFTQYVAGLTKEDFPNIEKIHNSSGFKLPREYYTTSDVNSTIEPLLKKRKRTEVVHLNMVRNENKPKRSRKRKENIVILNQDMIMEEVEETKEPVKEPVKEAVEVSPKNTKPKKSHNIERSRNDDVNAFTSFFKSISEKSMEDVVLMRTFQVEIDTKIDFIETLPLEIYQILKRKGGIDLSGFIKTVKLTEEEECKIGCVKILSTLYKNSLISKN